MSNPIETKPYRLHVLFFSILKEKVGRAALQVSLPPPLTGRDLLDHLTEAYPVLRPYRNVIRLGVNEEYVEEATPLHDGDEVALITPVSGG